MLDQFAVADGSVTNGQLEDAIEDHPPAPRAASIEAEDELVEVAGQVGLVEGALMGAQEPPLGQRRNHVDSRQELAGVVPVGTCCSLAAWFVEVAALLEPDVARPGIGDDPRARLDVIGYEGHEGRARSIAQDRHPATTDSLRLLDPGPRPPPARLILLRSHRRLDRRTPEARWGGCPPTHSGAILPSRPRQPLGRIS